MNNPFLENLYSKLPSNFRNADEGQQFQLKRFLDIALTGGFMPLKEETKGLLSLIDYDKVPRQFLPHLASELGFTFPYDLDEETQRTYIKNAVLTYRSKGTKDTLEFMIRELTGFMVNAVTDDVTKTLLLYLEVDAERQDFDNLLNKVDFLVNEYSPPYAFYQLINSFIWNEDLNKNIFPSPADIRHHIIMPQVDFVYENSASNGLWFLTNDVNSQTNSLQSVTYFDKEIYDGQLITEEDMGRITFGPEAWEFNSKGISEGYSENDEIAVEVGWRILEANEAEVSLRVQETDSDEFTVFAPLIEVDYEEGFRSSHTASTTNNTPTISEDSYDTFTNTVEETLTDKVVKE